LGVSIRAVLVSLLVILVGCPVEPPEPTPGLDDDDATTPPDWEDCDWPPVDDPGPDPADCNADGLLDTEQLAAGEAFDCNSDGVLDECQVLDDACVTYGARQFTEYDVGNLPIILSAPHGGLVDPGDIPDRGAATGSSDINTIQLARAIEAALFERTGRHPHLIICQLHRDKIDCNRSLDVAQDGHPETEAAWFEYHAFIDGAKRAAVAQFGRALYIDLHGLAASRDKNEIGYLLYKGQLFEPDDRLDHPAYRPRSSVKTLVDRNEDLVEVLRGVTSLGAHLQGAGFESVPSPAYPDPGYDDEGNQGNYFNGGYNTSRHGSRDGGPVDGLQIETMWAGVRDSAGAREAFGGAVADGVLAWVEAHLGLDPEAESLVRLGPVQGAATGRGGTATLPIRRSGADGAIEVALSWAGGGVTPEAGALPTSVRFDAGMDEVVLEVAVQPGGTSEPIVVSIGPGAGYNVDPEAVEASIAVVSIGAPRLWFTGALDGLAEGDSLELEVRRDTCGFEQHLPVSFSGAATGDDVELPATVSFSVDGASSTLSFEALDDSELEGAEELVVEVEGEGLSAASAVRLVEADPDLVAGFDGLLDGGDLQSLTANSVGAAVLPSVLDGPQLIEGGPAGAYLAFDEEDDLVLIDDIPFDGAFTVSFAFRAHEQLSDGFRYLYGHGNVNGRNNLNVYLRTNGNLRTSLRGSGEASDFGALDVLADLKDGEWHHYALTVAPSAPEAIVYIDGLEAATAARGGPTFDPAHPIFLASRWDLSPSRDFRGDLDEVRILSRVVTAGEAAVMASPFLSP
jgi:hypothetical protein